MSEFATSEETMGKLHKKTADVLLAALEGETVEDDEGNTITLPPDSKAVAQAIAFLNTNKMTYRKSETQTMTEVEEALRSKKQRFKLVTDQAMQDAKKAAGLI